MDKFIRVLSEMARMTYFMNLENYIDIPLLLPISKKLGVEVTVLKYALSLVIACPLGIIMRLIPSRHYNVKHIYSAICGISLLQWVFGLHWIHSFISSTVTYIICKVASSSVQHYLVLIWVMCYLSVCHGYHMYENYLITKIDYRNTQMVLTIKLTSLAWNLYDGTIGLKNITENIEKIDDKKSKIYKDRLKFSISKLPNLLEYYGYIYCFSVLMVGPAFEFNEYNRAIHNQVQRPTHHDKDSSVHSTSTPTSTSTLPSSFRAGCGSLLQGLISLPIHLLISKSFPLLRVCEKSFIDSYSLWYRMVYNVIAIYGIRFRFYFAWKIAEAAATFSGFGFEGFDEQTGASLGWKGVQNVDVYGVETASRIQTVIRSWNKRTQGWLERYVYHRSSGSLLATYLFSSVWHGFYPGFYILFFYVAVLTPIERFLKNFLSSSSSSRSPSSTAAATTSTTSTTARDVLVTIICMIFTSMTFNYITTYFFLLSIERSFVFMKSYYFIPEMIVLGFYCTYFALKMTPTSTTAKKHVKKE